MSDIEAEASRIEGLVGHPGAMFEELLERVAADRIRTFAEVEAEWLALMWTLDAYRVAGVPPRGMGDATNPRERLAAVYRGKGNWFARLLATLLENQTAQRVAPKIKVKGFSQLHQIDLAWPEREDDPLLCAETKVTGAPAYSSYPERGAMADFSNRRKELKFAATDLKLFRRDQQTSIRHWGVWRETSPPKTYFMWAARLRRGSVRTLKKGGTRVTGRDSIDTLVRECGLLVDTYLDGSGVFAWQLNDQGTGYESVTVPHTAQVRALDDVLYRIASEIEQIAGPQGKVPPPIVPSVRVVPDNELPDDGAGPE